MKDTYRQKGLRKRMIEELRAKGIRDERILDAMWEIPRHYFLDVAFDEWAYKDKAFGIACDQTISQPYTVARQTELLEVKSGDKILEIGTGSGYQASILANMGAKVYSIERIETLHKQAGLLLKKLGIHVRLYLGDGYKGLKKHAPFQKIIVTAGAPEIPEALLHQLADGGIMVIPVGKGKTQKMYRITKKDTQFIREDHGDYRFVPLLPGLN